MTHRLVADLSEPQHAFVHSTADVSMMVGGRGAGKTIAGILRCLQMRRSDGVGMIVAPTYRMLVDIVLETFKAEFPWAIREFRASQMKLTLITGVSILLRSGDRPDSLRGPNIGWLWIDEACFLPDESVTIAMATVRAGREAIWFTTTPVKNSMVHRVYVESEAPCQTVYAPTSSNPWLSKAYVDRLRAAMGVKEQARELDAQWTDSDGAMFDMGAITRNRRSTYPDLHQIAIGVDPAVSSNKRSDLTGIVVMGMCAAGKVYVIEDLSGQLTPHGWASVCVDAVHRYRLRFSRSAVVIVAERNQGGDMVEATIRAVDVTMPVVVVHASASKQDRARPVAAAMSADLIHHVGVLRDLESQMTGWEPGDPKSPDRMDAYVHGVTYLRPVTRHLTRDTSALRLPAPKRKVRA